MQIEVDMTYEQYFEANRTWLLHTTAFRRWNFWIIWYVAPVCAVVFIAISVLSYVNNHGFDKEMGWSGLWIGLCLWCRFSFPAKVRKLYRKQEKHFSGWMDLGPSGLSYERKNGTATTQYSWNAFETWIENPDAFLLMPGVQSFVRIPKNKLTVPEQDEVRGWISAVVKAAK